MDRILDMLGTEEAVAASRRYPALRPAVGRRIVRAAARQSAAIGAVPLGGAAMPVLTLLQIKMVGQLATLYGRPMDAERIALALSVLGAGFGWRALGRTAVGHVPGPGGPSTAASRTASRAASGRPPSPAWRRATARRGAAAGRGQAEDRGRPQPPGRNQ